jgi:hypothetical protein
MLGGSVAGSAATVQFTMVGDAVRDTAKRLMLLESLAITMKQIRLFCTVASGAAARTHRDRNADGCARTGARLAARATRATSFCLAIERLCGPRRWPEEKITLRQGARVVEKNWRE